MNNISVNGKIMAADEPALLAANRGYRYGDGLFETIKMLNGRLVLVDYHFERLFAGLALLKFDTPKFFTAEKLQQEILHLAKRNECEKAARVRLSVFRGNGGLYDADKRLEWLIECWPLNESVNRLNENGLVIGVYTDARKNCDAFANLKSANFLPYAMAAIFVKENKWNDAILLNNHGRLADSTIANLFIIKKNTIITPPLQEGCVNGVMRRHIITELRKLNRELVEKELSTTDLANADEVFLTNAINGIRWVKQFEDKQYVNLQTAGIYQSIVQPLLH